MEAHGRLRIKRARQALAISEDCADAWVLLAEEASTHAAVKRYRALLELNPGDNQGVRYVLLAALLERGLNEEAGVA